MVVAGHFIIAFGFIILLYLGATYSSLCYESDELQQFLSKIDELTKQREVLVVKLAQQPDDSENLKNECVSIEKSILYFKNRYNENLAYFNNRKKSIFTKIIMVFSKRFDQNFVSLP